jgi:hypothetical protein
MSYLIKLHSDNCYLISDGEGDMITTNSRQEAIRDGLFDDFESADETAQCFSGGMTRGVDYVIESISQNQYYAVQISIPVEKAPRLKDIQKFIKNDTAQVFLTNKTTENDAMDGLTRYGVSTGTNAVLLKNDQYEARKEAISQYLAERFGNHWEIKLLPVRV